MDRNPNRDDRALFERIEVRFEHDADDVSFWHGLGITFGASILVIGVIFVVLWLLRLLLGL